VTELEPDRATLEAWLQAFSAMALDELDALATAPAVGSVGADGIAIASEVSLPIRERPRPAAALARTIARASRAALNTPGPGYLAYIPGGGLPSAGIAELVAAWLNRYTGVATAAPALCRLEADVLAWLAAQFGYPEGARGLLTSGGSLANFSAVVTARHAMLGDDGDYREAIVYTSTQAHHSVAKSVSLAGIPPGNVRAVSTDARLRMDVGALREAVQADRAAGRRPFLVVSAAGTTNTGAIDPLPELAEIAGALQLWHHVDGAYGGAFALCESGRPRLRGIERANSIAFDPHKGLFLPYGTGCLLVRDGEALRQAHLAHAAYLQDFETLEREGEAPSPYEYGPELSRPFRGLRLWLPLQLHGAAAFRAALDEKLALAERFAGGLSALAPVEVVDPPQLSVVAFRLRRAAGEPVARWNERNAAFLAAVNGRGRVYVSSTSLPVQDSPGQWAYTLRACVLSFRTHAERIEAALEDVAAAALR
jgi:aromatic-L-amino-acid decarboxylase